MRDSELLKRLHLELLNEPCEVCELRVGTRLHHVKYRSRGGDDTRENMLWVCEICDASHGDLPNVSRYG